MSHRPNLATNSIEAILLSHFRRETLEKLKKNGYKVVGVTYFHRYKTSPESVNIRIEYIVAHPSGEQSLDFHHVIALAERPDYPEAEIAEDLDAFIDGGTIQEASEALNAIIRLHRSLGRQGPEPEAESDGEDASYP